MMQNESKFYVLNIMFNKRYAELYYIKEISFNVTKNLYYLYIISKMLSIEIFFKNYRANRNVSALILGEQKTFISFLCKK